MTNPKTIACDKCGHRMEDIPDKCPECGELIHDRMDPYVRERIRGKMNLPVKRWILLLIAHTIFIILAIVAGICVYDYTYSVLPVYCIVLFPLLLLAIYYSVSVASRKRKKIIWYHLGLYLSLSFLGLLSCWISKTSCEKHIAKLMSQNVMRGKPFYILPEHATPETVAIFKSARLKFTVLDCTPWMNVEPGRIECPFILSVKAEERTGSCAGSGGKAYSLCLFGIIIPLWFEHHWMS